VLPKGRHITPLNGRGYGHVTVSSFAVCRDAARRAFLSAIADSFLVFTVFTVYLCAERLFTFRISSVGLLK